MEELHMYKVRNILFITYQGLQTCTAIIFFINYVFSHIDYNNNIKLLYTLVCWLQTLLTRCYKQFIGADF